MIIAQYVMTKNDVNGNPRRGWVMSRQQPAHDITGNTSTPLGFIDEGYAGYGALTREVGRLSTSTMADVVELPALTITPGQYRDLKKRRFPYALNG